MFKVFSLFVSFLCVHQLEEFVNDAIENKKELKEIMDILTNQKDIKSVADLLERDDFSLPGYEKPEQDLKKAMVWFFVFASQHVPCIQLKWFSFVFLGAQLNL